MKPLQVPSFLLGLWGGAFISLLGAFFDNLPLAAGGCALAAATLTYETVWMVQQWSHWGG